MDKKTSNIIRTLKEIIPNPHCELEYGSNFQLLVAVILSAQCTDKRVNIVTKQLFAKYDTPQKLANANQDDVEEIIKSCGFYKNKASNIIECSKQLVARHNGQVPNTIEELTNLKGVGRKTANVVLCEAFKIPAMPVDTHVYRVSNRLGLAQADSVFTCEKQLMKRIPKEDWIATHHMLILFGRNYCKAINPKCDSCPFANICKYKRRKI